MKGILLMAYGTPRGEAEVEQYYTDIRRGRRPTKEEADNLKDRYRSIGGGTPLLEITLSTAAKLESSLRQEGNEVRVIAGMKHWHPYISEVFPDLLSNSIDELLAIALAPHYSKMSIGGYQSSVLSAQKEQGSDVLIRFVDSWYHNQVFLEKWVARIHEASIRKFDVPKSDIFFLFSAHSLPERILTWNDPYKTQLTETMEELAARLSLRSEQYSFAFQSAGHTSEPWLGPDLLEVLPDLRLKWKHVLVIPVGFVSDHLEILFDIDKEAVESATKLGIHLERTESFNDSEDFIQVLKSVVSDSGFLGRK